MSTTIYLTFAQVDSLRNITERTGIPWSKLVRRAVDRMLGEIAELERTHGDVLDRLGGEIAREELPVLITPKAMPLKPGSGRGEP